MLGFKRTSSGVSDKPLLKAKRYKYIFKWDSRANRGRGAYVKDIRVKEVRRGR